MDILLRPDLQQFVSDKLKAGQYPDASDIVNQALEVLREQEQFTSAQEAFFRHEVGRGIEQLDQGQCADFNAESIIADERRRRNQPGND